jgi:hypothetical protein
MNSPNLRTQNPGFNLGFTPLYITNAGLNPGLKPGFGVLRCGPCIHKTRASKDEYLNATRIFIFVNANVDSL